MPLHENITDEAKAALAADKKRRLWGALSIAALVIALLCIILAAYFVIMPPKDTPVVRLISTPAEKPPVEDSKNDRNNRQRQTSRPAPPSHVPMQDMLKVNAPTDVTVPPRIDNTLPFTLSNPQDNTPNLPGDDLKVVDKLIGDEEGTGLTGTFYDLKQTQGGRPTNLSPAEVAGILKDFVTAKNWNEQQFAKYYQSPIKLRNPFFFIPRMKATAAPEAFGCGDKVKDGRWVAIYRGKVKVPVSGAFRFVGAGDDAVVVRFNNKVVFDYGWYQLTQGKIASSAQWRDAMKDKPGNDALKKDLRKAGVNIPPVTFHTYSNTPHWNNSIGGLVCGPGFEVEAGNVYPIEILISEIPGGEFGAILLIENMGVQAQKKDKTGSPILPLFRVANALPQPEIFRGKEFPAYDPVGPIWQVVEENK